MNKKLLVFALLFVLVLISSIFVSARIVELEAEREQFKKDRTFEIYSSLLLLFVSVAIILISWIWHIKAEDSFKYIKHGILGFFVASSNIFISLYIFIFLNKLILNVSGYVIPFWWIYVLFVLGGCVFQFIFYKRTGKLYWLYALMFSIILALYVIIRFFNIRSFEVFVMSGYGWKY